MCCTCSLLACPLPTTACLTWSAVYSDTGSPASTAAQIAVPRAWPSASVDTGLTLTKTFSSAICCGRCSAMTSRRLSRIVLRRPGGSLFRGAINPLGRAVHPLPAQVERAQRLAARKVLAPDVPRFRRMLLPPHGGPLAELRLPDFQRRMRHEVVADRIGVLRTLRRPSWIPPERAEAAADAHRIIPAVDRQLIRVLVRLVFRSLPVCVPQHQPL